MSRIIYHDHKSKRTAEIAGKIHANKIQAHVNRNLYKKNNPSLGPRQIFMNYIIKDNLLIEQAINKFLEEHSDFSRQDLIMWLSEECKKLDAIDSDKYQYVKRWISDYEENMKLKESDVEER